MNQENKFPPRLWIESLDVFNCGYALAYPNADKFDHHLIEPSIEYLPITEHSAILAGVNNQLQACSRQIDQFQSKLCEQDEALKIARDALREIFDYNSSSDSWESNRANEAQQKIDEILNKKENE